MHAPPLPASDVTACLGPPCSSLPTFGLQGSLPGGGWDLPELLTWLDLSHNEIQGSVADLRFPGSLKQAYISGAGLGGSLPNGWRHPTLETLRLANNSISGRVGTCARAAPHRTSAHHLHARCVLPGWRLSWWAARCITGRRLTAAAPPPPPPPTRCVAGVCRLGGTCLACTACASMAMPSPARSAQRCSRCPMGAPSCAWAATC